MNSGTTKERFERAARLAWHSYIALAHEVAIFTTPMAPPITIYHVAEEERSSEVVVHCSSNSLAPLGSNSALYSVVLLFSCAISTKPSQVGSMEG